MRLSSITQPESPNKMRWPARTVLTLAGVLALTGLGTAAYAAARTRRPPVAGS